MAKLDKTHPVNLQELIVSSLAMADALVKLLIEKGFVTQDEFMRKLSEERATYQRLLNPTPQ
jgi:ParB-like chromosome segregation protein Spo0J